MIFKRLRTLVATGIIILIIVGTLWGIGFGTFCFLNVGAITFICPIGFLELCLSNRTVYWKLMLPFFVVIGLIVFLGRTFCSWACPVNLVFGWPTTFLNRILPKKVGDWWLNFNLTVFTRLSKLGYRDGIALMVGALAGVAIFQYPFISTFCPIGVVARNAISLFSHFQLKSDIFLLLFAWFLGVFFVNGWKSCCPAGTILGVIARINRTFVPEVNGKKCIHCGICEKVCPSTLALLKQRYDPGVCCKCLSCIDHCPQKAMHLTFLNLKDDSKNDASIGTLTISDDKRSVAIK